MSRIIALTCLVACVVGCQVPSSPSGQVKISDRATLAPGARESVEQYQLYAITVEDGSPDAIATYEGRVITSNTETITLERPLMIAKRERKKPSALSRIPILARQFKNVGMATEQLSRNVTIPRTDIVDLKKLKPRERIPST
jgi:hypothetical protein